MMDTRNTFPDIARLSLVNIIDNRHLFGESDWRKDRMGPLHSHFISGLPVSDTAEARDGEMQR